MEKCKVEFLQPALDDLEDIILYIAKDSLSNALRMHDEIVTQAKKLETFPKLGREIPFTDWQVMRFTFIELCMAWEITQCYIMVCLSKRYKPCNVAG